MRRVELSWGGNPVTKQREERRAKSVLFYYTNFSCWRGMDVLRLIYGVFSALNLQVLSPWIRLIKKCNKRSLCWKAYRSNNPTPVNRHPTIASLDVLTINNYFWVYLCKSLISRQWVAKERPSFKTQPWVGTICTAPRSDVRKFCWILSPQRKN